MVGLKRVVATRAPMYKAARTRARPPHTARRPRRVPESRFKGATPTRAARRFRSSVPSSGSSASSVLASTGPTPGTLLSKASFSRLDRLVQITFDALKFPLQPPHVRLDALLHGFARRGAEAVSFGGEHAHDLAP